MNFTFRPIRIFSIDDNNSCNNLFSLYKHEQISEFFNEKSRSHPLDFKFLSHLKMLATF